jgi:hypothetical protein
VAKGGVSSVQEQALKPRVPKTAIGRVVTVTVIAGKRMAHV